MSFEEKKEELRRRPDEEKEQELRGEGGAWKGGGVSNIVEDKEQLRGVHGTGNSPALVLCFLRLFYEGWNQFGPTACPIIYEKLP